MDNSHLEDIGPYAENTSFCCGLKELGSFDDIEEMWEEEEISYKEGFKRDRDDVIKKIKQKQTTSFFVTLNGGQWKIWEELLFKLGLRQVAEFLNPNTCNMIRLYLWLPVNERNKYV